MSLVVQRNFNEACTIAVPPSSDPTTIIVTLCENKDGKTVLAFDAPLCVSILRDDAVNREPPTPKDQHGVVKFWLRNLGYGFIIPDDGGADLFFHHGCLRGEDKELHPEDRVSFDVQTNSDRGLLAVNVRRVQQTAEAR